MESTGLGMVIRTTYTGSITCADDLVLTAWSTQEKKQLDLINILANKDLLTIHTYTPNKQKTKKQSTYLAPMTLKWNTYVQQKCGISIERQY